MISLLLRITKSLKYRIRRRLRQIILPILNSKCFEFLLFYYYYHFVFKGVSLKSDTKPRVLCGPCPIINNKYWANALKKYGYKAESITTMIPKINKREDFDILIDELSPISGERDHWKIVRQKLRVFNFILKEFDVFLMAFRFNYFDGTAFENRESNLLRKYGKKVIIIPYGSDYYKYSKVIDQSMKHNLLINMPDEIFNEGSINEKVNYWTKNADFIIVGVMLDDAARWDMLPLTQLCIDTDNWKRSSELSNRDGRSFAVTVVHAPNHRGFKGSEFIIHAINELKEEGLKINFVLLENVPNEEVKRILTTEADILVEQIIFTGFGLNGLEGMASGLPVLSNWENPDISILFRRYSSLNECPIVSTTPENIKENLRKLITNPILRKELGDASRRYAIKYNSYEAFLALFKEIEKSIWKKDKKADPMNFFHPLKTDSYNNRHPKIKHPLINNRIVDVIVNHEE